ncbi:LuxR family transcriptional regulator [Mycobacterium tuberculosis]|nr:LuxR family transcriptional regulator [Mycobacterium tuberculosis]
MKGLRRAARTVSTAAGTVAAGVAVNQILNGGIWNISWLIASMTIATAAEAANFWLGRLDTGPGDRSAGPLPPPRAGHGEGARPELVRDPGRMAVPRQLPRPIRHFTNRTVELAALDRLHRSGTGLVIVSGLGGVGKTAFAVHWAHLNSALFPDGQLYADLAGDDPANPITAEEVLSNFLRALGNAPEQIPIGSDAMAAAFRSEVVERRMLIILDGAASASQIRRILPSGAGCLVVVTSRNRLESLRVQDGAGSIELNPLAESDALELLRSVSAMENDRISDPLTQLARRCGFLPLTIRIAAGCIRGQDAAFVRDLVGGGDQRRPGPALFLEDGEGGAMPEDVVAWSYESLPPDAARMFRLSGLHTGSDFSLHAAAAAAGVDLAEAGRLLSLLGEACLLERTGDGRYQFHDLVKTHALERLKAEEAAERRHIAARRVIGFYARTADNADRVIAPERRHVAADTSPWALTFESPQDAVAWCAVERRNLITVIDQAVLLGFDEYAWRLPIALIYFFVLHSHPVDRYNTALIAVAAARRLGDRDAEAWSQTCVGGAALALGEPLPALERFQAALSLCEEAGDISGRAANLGNIGATLVRLGRYDEALDSAAHSLRLFGDLGDARGESIQSRLLASIHRRLGDVDQAYRRYEAAIAMADGVDLQAKGDALQELGELSGDQGRHADAVDCLRRALEIRRGLDDRAGAAATLLSLASPLIALGAVDSARADLGEALEIYEALGNAGADDVRTRLDELNRR